MRYSLPVAVIVATAHRSGDWPHLVRSAMAAEKSRTIAARESTSIGFVVSDASRRGTLVVETSSGSRTSIPTRSELDSVPRAQPTRPRVSAIRSGVVRDNSASADSSDVTSGMCEQSVPRCVAAVSGRGGIWRR